MSEQLEDLSFSPQHDECAKLLTKWDGDEPVWTVEMGGMMGGIGPGYEQAIQTAMFEILRTLLVEQPDATLWTDDKVWRADRDRIEKLAMPRVKGLGLSSAQWGAAFSLSSVFYSRGPQAALNSVPKEHHILVSKGFPGLEPKDVKAEGDGT